MSKIRKVSDFVHEAASNDNSSIYFNDLPDLCIEAILKRVGSPSQLLSKYRLVCSVWRNYIESMCQRHSLLITISRDSEYNCLQQIEDRFFQGINLMNFIKLRCNLNPNPSMPLYCYQRALTNRKFFYTFVLRIFPRPKEVVLQFEHARSFSSIVSNLLLNWTPYLTTLSINHKFKRSAFSLANRVNIFVNQCTVLKCLDLNLYMEAFYRITTHLSETILKKIEHFSGRGCIPIEYMDYLFGENSKCTRLMIFEVPHMWLMKFNIWCAEHTNWKSKLTHLYLVNEWGTFALFPIPFKSLKVLSLYNIDSPRISILFDVNLVSKYQICL
jgi:hypothetical protein